MAKKRDQARIGSILDDDAEQWLQAEFKDAVRFGEPMSAHTSFHIGGPADAWVEPESLDQLKGLVRWSRKKEIAYMVVGGGTNMLVADEGLRGLVISMNRLTEPLEWAQDQDRLRLTAAAGVPTRRLCALALRHGWRGMNFAVGIPGLLGGAVCMNAGTGGRQMADVLDAVLVVTGRGRERRLERHALGFDYRRMTWPRDMIADTAGAPIVVRADIELAMGQGHRLRNQAREMLRTRARTQPIGDRCAGSFFKNPSRETPAGRLIDEAGLKGASVGDAQVSPHHANFIINRGRATAADVLRLKALVEETVWNRFGIRLEPEVRIVGQSQDA